MIRVGDVVRIAGGRHGGETGSVVDVTARLVFVRLSHPEPGLVAVSPYRRESVRPVAL